MDIDVIALETDLYGPVVSSLEEAVSAVAGLGPDTAVLVKGSRSSRTERVVDALMNL
jgi:UDP-N-acetylmuramyl pentapeptide synthase